MKDFRNDLLEYLLEQSGEMLDIREIISKYCGEDNTFENGDDTLIKCRLKVNRVLRELEEMKWINLYPQGGLSTAHQMNHDIKKRQFIIDYAVSARLTTTGEIEYKKIKNQENPTPRNEIKVGDGFSGVLVQGSVLSDTDLRPKINSTTVHQREASKTGINTSIGKFIMNNIIWVIITTVVGGLIVGFLLHKFGWV